METLPRLKNRQYSIKKIQTGGSQNGSACEVTSVSEVRCSHHILWVVHLLRQLWNRDGTEIMSATTGQWSKADHEEMQTRKWNHVDGQFAKIRVQLTGKAEACRYTRHDSRDKMVQIAIGRVVEL